MHTATRDPRDLLTVQEAARILRVSDDTVRRQIKEGDLTAVQIGTTPQGRARLRIPGEALERRLRLVEVTAPSPLEQFRALFGSLDDTERETFLAQALTWAREQAPAVILEGRQPEPALETLKTRRAFRQVSFPTRSGDG